MTALRVPAPAVEREVVRPDAARNGLAAAAVATYVVLWLLEGAFRKWVPATGTLMYVFRDVALVGFVLVQYATAPKRRGAMSSLAFWSFTGLLIVLAAAQIVLVGSPEVVVVLGLRNYLAPVAFVYFFWRFWRSKGLLIVRLLLLSMAVQFLVTAAQVVSPASAFVNISVDGGATQLGTANGVVRGSGTFSDAGTLATYATIIFAVCLALLSDRRKPVRAWWVFTVLSLDVLMMTIAGERTAIFGSAAVLLVWLLSEVGRAELRSLVSVGAVLAAGTVLFLVASAAYPTAVASFGQRFVTANTQEDSVGRVIGSAVGFLQAPLTFLGSGAGTRSNVAVALGGGSVWIETEQARWVAELGVLGLVTVLVRIAVGIGVGFKTLFGLTRLAPLTITMSCVLGPQLIAGSIGVNPAVQGGAAIAGALYVWSGSRSARTELAEPGLIEEPS